MTRTTAQLRAREAALLDELERRKSPSERQADAILEHKSDADEYDPSVDTSEQQARHLLGDGKDVSA